MNILTSLYNSGADSYKNLFLVEFSLTSSNYNDAAHKSFLDSLSVRCSDFNPPEYEQSEYTVKFMNVSIPKPAPKISVTRNFKLTFRLDENYDIYKYLLELQKETFDYANNVTKVDINSLDTNGKLLTVKVYSMSGDMVDINSGTEELNTNLLFKYSKCWIDNITLSDYSHSSTDPMTVTVSVNYINMDTSAYATSTTISKPGAKNEPSGDNKAVTK